MARASAECTVSPTMPRMSYSRRMVGSNWCAGWLIQTPDGRDFSVARLGPAHAFIGEAQAAHFLGVEDVAQIDDARLAHDLLDTPRIESAELVPFGDHDQHVRFEGRLVSRLGKGDAGDHAPGLLHPLGIESDD